MMSCTRCVSTVGDEAIHRGKQHLNEHEDLNGQNINVSAFHVISF